MYEDVKLRLKYVLTQALRLDRAPETIPDTNLIVDIGIDSINSLEFLVWVENEFDIEIADQDLAVSLVDSLDQLAAYVVARAKSSAAVSTNLGENP